MHLRIAGGKRYFLLIRIFSPDDPAAAEGRAFDFSGPAALFAFPHVPLSLDFFFTVAKVAFHGTLPVADHTFFLVHIVFLAFIFLQTLRDTHENRETNVPIITDKWEKSPITPRRKR
jgi:hypothetical protein